MNKAFIFDMDGVLIDCERQWQLSEKPMLKRVLGDAIADRLPSTVGLNAQGVYEKAQELGSSVSIETLIHGYEELAPEIYARSKLTPDTGLLVQILVAHGFKVGLVTQSSQRNIDFVLQRLDFSSQIERTLSLFQHSELRPKPYPDGYREMFRELDAEASKSIVLEDSNAGIRSAKAAGAFVIGFRENLVEGYEQTGADTYADTMKEVMSIVGRSLPNA